MSASEADEGSSRDTLPGSLTEIHKALLSIQQDYRQIAGTLEAIHAKVDIIGGIKQVRNSPVMDLTQVINHSIQPEAEEHQDRQASIVGFDSTDINAIRIKSSTSARNSSASSRIILTTYPGQAGIDPIPMNWGHPDLKLRGPVVVSRSQSTIRRRNGMAQISIFQEKSLPLSDNCTGPGHSLQCWLCLGNSPNILAATFIKGNMKTAYDVLYCFFKCLD